MLVFFSPCRPFLSVLISFFGLSFVSFFALSFTFSPFRFLFRLFFSFFALPFTFSPFPFLFLPFVSLFALRARSCRACFIRIWNNLSWSDLIILACAVKANCLPVTRTLDQILVFLYWPRYRFHNAGSILYFSSFFPFYRISLLCLLRYFPPSSYVTVSRMSLFFYLRIKIGFSASKHFTTEHIILKNAACFL